MYNCEICIFKTNNKRDYNKHLSTNKHMSRTLYGGVSHICGTCCKKYKNRQGLWKHRKKSYCLPATTTVVSTPPSTDINSIMNETNNELINQLIKETQDLKNMLVSPSSPASMIKPVRFVVNDFLNVTCAGAINIDDFVHSIIWSTDDIDYLGNYGGVDCTIRLFSNALSKLDGHCSPIWCSDEKRNIFYIKNSNNIWERDNTLTILTRAINRIKHCSNQIAAFNLWKSMYPGCKESGHIKNDLLIKISIAMFDINPAHIHKIVQYIANKTKIVK